MADARELGREQIEMTQGTDDDHATITVADHVCTITLNRPDKRNSISLEMLDNIDAGFERAIREDARVVVIRGNGGHFCAGADLAFVSSLLKDEGWKFEAEFLPRVQATMNRIEDSRIPVVAAVEGYCLAGGFEMALCCDIVVAATSAQMGDGHSIFGFLPGSGGAWRLARKLGSNQAKYLAFLGEPVSAHEMATMGLVSRVFEDAEFSEGVTELCAKLAKRSPLGLRRMKETIEAGLSSDRVGGLLAERLASAAHVGSYDMHEGLAAFHEKRAPRFKGR